MNTGIEAFDNKWHHLVVTISSSAIILYVDGEYRASKTNTTVVPVSKYPKTFGIMWNGVSGASQGCVRMVRAYNRVLNTTEIQTNYAQCVQDWEGVEA